MINELITLRKKIEIDSYIKVERKYDDITLKDILYKEEITNFINIVKSNVDDQYFNLMYNNFNSLTIEDNLNLKDAVLGEYLPQKNIILIKEFSKKTLFHEALHAASSLYTKDNIICNCGFNQIRYNKDIGKGLNEWYTEILAMKFTNNNIKTIICNETISIMILEKLIGQEKMMQYYFSANLNGFVNELAKYCDINDVYAYINALDLDYKTFINRKEKVTIYNKYLISVSSYYAYKIIAQYSINKYGINFYTSMKNPESQDIKFLSKADEFGSLIGTKKAKKLKIN